MKSNSKKKMRDLSLEDEDCEVDRPSQGKL
jgi:hypothetical protein